MFKKTVCARGITPPLRIWDACCFCTGNVGWFAWRLRRKVFTCVVSGVWLWAEPGPGDPHPLSHKGGVPLRSVWLRRPLYDHKRRPLPPQAEAAGPTPPLSICGVMWPCLLIQGYNSLNGLNKIRFLFILIGFK